MAAKVVITVFFEGAPDTRKRLAVDLDAGWDAFVAKVKAKLALSAVSGVASNGAAVEELEEIVANDVLCISGTAAAAAVGAVGACAGAGDAVDTRVLSAPAPSNVGAASSVAALAESVAPASTTAATAHADAHPALPTPSITTVKPDALRFKRALDALKPALSTRDVLSVCDALRRIVNNLRKHPAEPKFRRLNASNAGFHARLGRHAPAMLFLELLGFRPQLSALTSAAATATHRGAGPAATTGGDATRAAAGPATAGVLLLAPEAEAAMPWQSVDGALESLAMWCAVRGSSIARTTTSTTSAGAGGAARAAAVPASDAARHGPRTGDRAHGSHARDSRATADGLTLDGLRAEIAKRGSEAVPVAHSERRIVVGIGALGGTTASTADGPRSAAAGVVPGDGDGATTVSSSAEAATPSGSASPHPLDAGGSYDDDDSDDGGDERLTNAELRLLVSVYKQKAERRAMSSEEKHMHTLQRRMECEQTKLRFRFPGGVTIQANFSPYESVRSAESFVRWAVADGVDLGDVRFSRPLKSGLLARDQLLIDAALVPSGVLVVEATNADVFASEPTGSFLRPELASRTAEGGGSPRPVGGGEASGASDERAGV